MHRYKYFILFLFLFISKAKCQQLTSGEYYFDRDPGFGNGIGIPVISGDSIIYSGNVPLNGLNNGFHSLNIRVHDTNGIWSFSEKRLFYIQSIPSFSPQLISGEYYFDTDPGFGNGIQMTISQGDSILFAGNIALSTLSTGFHSLFIRAKDLDGNWSLSEKRLFYIQNANVVSAPLIAAEYFINTDPGFGNGIHVAVTAGDSIDFVGPLPLLDTALGDYSLFLRVKDASGKWSIPERRDFKICLPPVADFDYSVNGNYSVIFSDSSLHRDTANWDFGDGATSILLNPIHSYSHPGAFTVCLIERNACGGDSICKTVEVPDIHLTSVSKSEVIPGDTFSVWFSANLYQSGNVFYLEANGYDGTFNNPFLLDSVSGNSNGIFTNVIMPYNITPNCYNLRIRSTSPKATTSEVVIIKVSSLANTSSNFTLKFDGVDDYVDLGTWFNQSQFTVSFWVKPDSVQNSGAAIIDMQNDLILYSNPTSQNNYVLSHLLQFDLIPNSWNHVTMTMDGSTNTRKVYLFGQLICENAWNYSPQVGHTMSLGNGGFLPGYFKGYMDELKIWDQILSTQEIFNQVNSPLTGNENGLLAYYDFNLGCNGIVDLTNNHHNGTSHGAISVASDLNSIYGNNIQPISSGNAGFVTVKIFHGHFTSGCTVKLKQAGYNTITALSAHIDSWDNSLICQFFFNSDSIGTYNVSVENLDSTLLFFPDAFTLNALISPSVIVDIYSRTLVRPGFKQNIIINCRNSGNIDAIGTLLFIYLPYGSDFTISDSIIVLGDSLIDLDSIPDYFVDAPFAFMQDSFFVVPLMIPVIEANSFRAIRITLKNPMSNSYIAAAVGKPLYSQTSFNSNNSLYSLSQTCDNIDALECTLDIITMLHGLLPEPAGCIIGTLNTIIKAVLDVNCKPIDDDFKYGLGRSVIAGLMSCYGMGKLEAIKNASKILKIIAESVMGISDRIDQNETIESCKRALKGPDPVITPLIPINSFDPNLKIAPQTYQSINDFDYSIYFENKPTATAAAQEVTIIDSLDLQRLDPNTFNFIGFGFGSENKIIQAGNRFNFSYVENINTNSVATIQGNLDTITGIVTWEFKTLDRLTGLLTEDPLEGFLPPNDSSGKGEGYVAYSIKPKPNLSNNDSISNGATIVFDFNEPIMTNTAKNILDLDKPFSNVIQGDSIVSDTSFVISWTGNDSTSSIKNYRVYVSDSLGQYFEWLTSFHDTSNTFSGKAGHYYRFYTVATDSAGNIEDAPYTEDYYVFIDGFQVNAIIRLFIEGFYLSDSTLISTIDPVLYPNVCDTVTIELHSSTSPYSIKYSYKGILDIHGFIQCHFENVLRGLYYVVIKHRNAIETWSSNPVAINSSYFEYDFTTIINKAYGDNMLNVGNGRFAIFSGDISDFSSGVGYQDAVIESQDYLDMENAVSQILVGYIVQDITGDGVVESADYIIMENNVSSIIFSVRP